MSLQRSVSELTVSELTRDVSELTGFVSDLTEFVRCLTGFTNKELGEVVRGLAC